MKKIIILTAIGLSTIGLSAFSACSLDTLGACKADIGAGINDKLNDKILPNTLDQKIRPNNSFNNRSNLGKHEIPENVNMQPVQEESLQPYDANCQFGNCVNRQNSGGGKQ